METLIIEVQNPKARKLIEDLADLGLIILKETSSWSDRWKKFTSVLPEVSSISEEDILDEIDDLRQN